MREAGVGAVGFEGGELRHRQAGREVEREALKWKRLCIFGEKLSFAEAMGYN